MGGVHIMKIFTRWEICLFIKYVKMSPFNFIDPSKSPAFDIARTLHMDITVNELRAVMGCPPHPDYMFHPGTDRGKKYIWEEETPQNDDYLIPTAIQNSYAAYGPFDDEDRVV
jgi:hypothetical protein